MENVSETGLPDIDIGEDEGGNGDEGKNSYLPSIEPIA